MWNFGKLVVKDGYYTDFFGNRNRLGTKAIEEMLFAAYTAGKKVIITFKDNTTRVGKIDCPYGLSLAQAENFRGGFYWYKDSADAFFGSEVKNVCIIA